jgi:carbamoyltransferase
MRIVGLKLTHDGSIALIDNQRLVFCYEMEKIGNNARYSPFVIGIEQIREIFTSHGYDFDQTDKLVIDGWTPDQQVFINLGTGNIPVELAGYGLLVVGENVLEARDLSLMAGIPVRYSSYLHVAGHITAAYCTSPMAKAGVDSYVLVWDGGMFPQLFYYCSGSNSVENLDVLFYIIGNIYAIFAQHFGPFRKASAEVLDDLSVAGKVMAYIAKGAYREEMISIFQELYDADTDKGMDFARRFAAGFLQRTAHSNFPPEDVLHTFHVFLEKMLVRNLTAKIGKETGRSRNLCIAGGSALNIKWNSAIRSSGLFDCVWVPPFPNDAGSAIGAACCEMIRASGKSCLAWDVYAGPPVTRGDRESGWTGRKLTVEELALLLFLENEPVVFLNGRAELGPRALGNRSILAPATNAFMKRVLNQIKNREDYRPVAPICLEQDAGSIFDPGSTDPYMLFDHKVRSEWLDRIPAICHLDGTARLQTVAEEENPIVFRLLQEYKRLSGIPLLCNTSANLNGCGFFPDVISAMRWGRVNYIWCDDVLYEKEDKIVFENVLSCDETTL